ncbi:MAG: peptidoglycan-associated lipoprotein Pal, partial [Smithella sp.]
LNLKPKERIIKMKNYITLKGVFVVMILSLLIFTGCAEKKSVVTGDTAQKQETITAPAAGAAAQKDLAKSQESSDAQAAGKEQSVDLEKMAKAESPVSDINFDFDSFSVRPDARDILKVNANYFMKHRVSSIVIEGHCDERGTAEYNMALGERRARETKQYLINLGIKESLIKTVSFGEERPLDPASNEDAWAKNRRAHFVVNE